MMASVMTHVYVCLVSPDVTARMMSMSVHPTHVNMTPHVMTMSTRTPVNASLASAEFIAKSMTMIVLSGSWVYF